MKSFANILKWVLLAPALLTILTFLISPTCAGNEGSGYVCLGSSGLGDLMFLTGFLVWLIFIPLSLIATPIALWLFLRNK